MSDVRMRQAAKWGIDEPQWLPSGLIEVMFGEPRVGGSHMFGCPGLVLFYPVMHNGVEITSLAVCPSCHKNVPPWESRDDEEGRA